jgi:glycosyltransferase involved in cell wall biosynthesis
MRVLICNWTRRKVGGIEDYLTSVMPGLRQIGHELAFGSATDIPVEREAIDFPEGTLDWCVDRLGEAAVLRKAKEWDPELIYAHGPLEPTFEEGLLDIAPAVYFAHNYFGTCISGYKAHRLPTSRPCNRTLAWPCLVNYFPRRCGGLNPVVMFKLYGQEQERMSRLRKYSAIVTHSEHMKMEYIRHGFDPSRLFSFVSARQDAPIVTPEQLTEVRPERARRVLFLGRMETLKGGEALIESAPLVQRLLGVAVQFVLAGDGPDKARWQRLSSQIAAANPLLSFSFPGWLNNVQISQELKLADVLAVPSLWPEPFGRVGVEAGQYGVPAAAFAVGGIPEWLKDGVNGFLAPGDPPTVGGLATAISRCLDQETAPRLRAGARQLAGRFSTSLHIEHLLNVFAVAVGGGSFRMHVGR